MAPSRFSFSAVPEEGDDEISLLDLLPGTVSNNPSACSASVSKGGAAKLGKQRRSGNGGPRPASRAGAAATSGHGFPQVSRVPVIPAAAPGGAAHSRASTPPSASEATWEEFARSSNRDRKQDTRALTALSIRSENDTVFQRIANLFDTRGLLRDQTPQNWALSLCITKPLHGIAGVEQLARRRDALTRRMREKNARDALERNVARTRSRIQSSIEQQEFERTTNFLDAQQSRQIVLLFNPIVQTIEEVPDDVIADILDEAVPVLSKESRGRRRSSGEIDFGSMPFRREPSSNAAPGPPAGREAQPEFSQAADGLSKGGLANDQRAILLTVFQSYVRRVTAKGELEMMQRCTWFRFLHHCGLLGSFECGGGGVSFSDGSKVFDAHADAQLSPPMLTFTLWIEALKHLVGSMAHRPPPKSNKEVLEYITGSLLTRCEARLKAANPEAQDVGQGSAGGEPTSPSGSVRGSTLRNRGKQPSAPRRRSSASASGSDVPMSPTSSTSPGRLRNGSRKAGRKQPWSFAYSPWSGDGAAASAAAAQAASTASPGASGVAGGFFYQSLKQVKDISMKGSVPRDLKHDVAEEQMCEPEVLQLLHEFEHPLRLIFGHYAGRASIGPCRCPIHAKVQRPRDETLQPSDSEKHFALTTPLFTVPPPLLADTESDVCSPVSSFAPAFLSDAVGQDKQQAATPRFMGSMVNSAASVESCAALAAQASCDMDRQVSDESACLSEGGRNVATFSKATREASEGGVSDHDIFNQAVAEEYVSHRLPQPEQPAVAQNHEEADSITASDVVKKEAPEESPQHEVVAKHEAAASLKLGPSIVQRMGEAGSPQNAPAAVHKRNKDGIFCLESVPPRITEGTFLSFLKDFGVFPSMVQQHTAELHVRRTLHRRGTSKLTFTAFVETLCRIAFVHLNIYGNGVQQASNSKRKCLWLLMLLRSHCRRFGEKLCLDPSLVAELDDGPSFAWSVRQEVDIENVRLKELLLFRVLDASLDNRPLSPRSKDGRGKADGSGKRQYAKSTTFDSPTPEDV